MIAVQIADYFLLKTDAAAKDFSVSRLVIWAIGFAVYRVLMGVDLPLGNTLPDMVITVVITLAWAKLFEKKKS